MPNPLPPAVAAGLPGSAGAIPAPRVGAVPADPSSQSALRWTLDAITANSLGDPPGVVMSGELDMASAPGLRASVTEAVDAAVRSRTVVTTFLLDLERVTFMDSAGLHALTDVHVQIRERGWVLGFTPPAACGPRRLLVLAAALDWLPVCPDHAQGCSLRLDGARGQ